MPATVEQTRVTESITLGNAKVDAEAGYIRGAKLIGFNSENGRVYSTEALRRAVPLYEGARVNLDHPGHGDGERKFVDWVGVIENVTERSDGLYGDISLRKSGASFGEIMEAAERFPKHFGLSHVADCEFHLQGGQEHISEINEVLSVDIVLEPATTNGLFESKAKPMVKPTNRTYRQIAESAPKGKLTSLFLEMLDAETPVVAPDAEVNVEQDASPEDAVRLGLLEALRMKMETADADSLKKAMTSLGMTDSASELVSGKTQEAEGEDGAEPKPDEDEKKTESRIRDLESKLATQEARNLLLEAAVEPTEVRVEALAKATNKKALLESWPKAAIDGGRPAASPPAHSSGDSSLVAVESRWKNVVERSRDRLAKR